MTTLKSIAASLALACLALPTLTRADEVTALQSELEALKKEYSSRIAALEERLAQLESQASTATVAAAPPDVSAPAPVAAGRNPAAAFNPATAVILAGNYANLSQDPETYEIAGFIPSGGEVGPGDRSFNLGESELTLAANIDPYFFGNLTAAITGENEIEVEEAYFKTIALPAGFSVKGGQFFSSIGYLNEIHAHAWDFVDQPLVYQAFFGGQLAQVGLQAKWIAPTDLFIEFGGESGSGQEFPGTRLNKNGLNNGTLYVHVGGDIGDSTSWRAGISWLDVRAADRIYDDADQFGQPVQNAFSGKSQTWIGDVVFKWAPNGNPTRNYLKVQGEYMRRDEDGDLAFDVDTLALSGDYSSRQSGWYLQSVYQFMPRWRVGARYDSLDSGTVDIGLVQSGLLPADAFPVLLPADPTRLTLMIDWSPSEFSRLRAQYAWDDARNTDTDREFQLQYIYSIGAHGAHKY